MADTSSAGRRPTVWGRMNAAINNNPIGTLILATAVIAAVFYGTLHDATSNLNSAAVRIDKLASEVGEIKGTLTGIGKEVAKIDSINQSLLQIRNFNASIDQQLRSLKSYEVRLIESFGIKADENLIVQIESGRVLAFPLTEQKRNQLLQAKFTETTTYLTEPIRAAGWTPPVRPAH